LKKREKYKTMAGQVEIGKLKALGALKGENNKLPR